MNIDAMSSFMDICALIFVVASGYYVVQWLRILLIVSKKGVADGKIVHVKIERKGNKENLHVTYSFRVDGKELTKSFNAAQNPAQLGDDVKVYYDPAHPEKNYSDLEEKNQRKIMLFCVITLILCGLLSLFAPK